MTVSTYPATVEGITAALEALGDTPDLVASNLLKGGFRGEVGECSRCPVALYLQAQFPGWLVYVGTDHLLATEVADADSLVSVDLPGAVVEFVDSFDRHGRYADLDVSCEVPS
jgi:hypothetical protein